MAIAIKKKSSPEPAPTSLPQEVQSQIASNTKLDTTDYTKPLSVEPKVEQKEAVQTESMKPAEVKETSLAQETLEPPKEEKGKRSDDVVQLKFSKGKRSEAKAFFALYDVKMNAGFEMAYEFLKEEVEAGRVKLSKSGIKRVEQ